MSSAPSYNTYDNSVSRVTENVARTFMDDGSLVLAPDHTEHGAQQFSDTAEDPNTPHGDNRLNFL
jgi:hypothetical protein